MDEQSNTIIVFKSNLARVHGTGIAFYAKEYYGATVENGFSGNSYAIPFKDKSFKKIKFEQQVPYIREFADFTKQNENFVFHMVDFREWGIGLSYLKQLGAINMIVYTEQERVKWYKKHLDRNMGKNYDSA